MKNRKVSPIRAQITPVHNHHRTITINSNLSCSPSLQYFEGFVINNQHDDGKSQSVPSAKIMRNHVIMIACKVAL